ncbi:peptidase S8 [Coprothermobacteraceae bacterium]|nr:peptidase S8 [Coprothermobacteraceae bacterium]
MHKASDRLAKAFGLSRVRWGYGAPYEVVQVSEGRDLGLLIAQLARDKDVEYVEPNYIAYALDVSGVPNDPFFTPYQWNFYDWGMQSNGYVSNYGVQAVSAWTISTGTGVKVAVVDTGVAYEDYGPYKQAPDLANTYFDAEGAYDFVNGDAHANDDEGHGTHVAGTIAQSTNNATGVAGIAYEATILPVKVLDANGSGTYDNIASGVRWAVDHGARVINLSLGGSFDSQTLHDAIVYARNSGVVVVCAAGNSGNPKIIYPAKYPECISVGATRFDGARTKYSSYGPQLKLVAPGGDLKVDQNKDGYKDGILQQTFDPKDPSKFGYYFYQGTSMATPHVSAIAALVFSVHPEFTATQVEQALLRTAKDLGATGWDKYFGYGLVNAWGAVNWTPSP